MREASRKDITKFLECKRVAVVRVSRQRLHFSRSVWREFLTAGYDAVPVNPQASEIEGRKCFARLSDITPPVEAALLLTGTPEATDGVLDECRNAGIGKIWTYKSFPDGKNHERAKERCRSQRATLVEGYCPLMFLPHAGFVHRAHGFFTKLAGHYPA